MVSILIIDDEIDIRELISDILEDEGYTTYSAHNAASALEKINNVIPQIIILDIWLEGSHMDGIGLLKNIKLKLPQIPIIMISGHGNIETAVQTIKLGAYDFIEKPFKSEKLLILIKRALETNQLIEENNLLKQKSKKLELIGTSKIISNMRTAVRAAAVSNSRVFITGGAGTGKATVANIIHYMSKNAGLPFITWHTTNKSFEDLNSELFIFLDMLDNHNISVLEKVNSGTLFIDEITDIPIILQSKLLNIIQSGYYVKPNDKKQYPFSARIIAASSKDVLSAIKNKQLDESLYYRLNIIRIDIPPLKDRKQDIKLLSEYFVKIFSQELNSTPCTISDEAYAVMQSYDWPGNIRQLRNAIEWLMIISANTANSKITQDMLPNDILQAINSTYNSINPMASNILSKPLKQARELFEKEYITSQLSKFNGNIAQTANFIGMDRAALYRKIKALNMMQTNHT